MTPERSLQQRMDALQRANAVRSARAQLKAYMKTDVPTSIRIAIGELASPSRDTGTWKARDLLLAVKQVGPVKVNKMLHDTGTSPSKTLGKLSPRQRRDLATQLARRLR